MAYPYIYTSQGKRITLAALLAELAPLRAEGRRIVTTNGCFDLLHPGHLAFLQQARALGDLLVVGLNSDPSVVRLKGAGRPLITEADRVDMLLALRCVDYVLVFDDALPNAWLQAVKPYRHCKAGDYSVESLPEAAAVTAGGGEIAILPLRDGFSTSALIGRISAPADQGVDSIEQSALQLLLDGSNVLRQTAYRYARTITEAAECITQAIRNGHKVLLCGNGGSAADAQHFAAELVGRFLRERQGWPAIALTVDSSILTGIGNDYGFAQVFARQVEALGRPGDVLLAISTSGRSENIIEAARQARAVGMSVLGMTGDSDSPLSAYCDLTFAIPSGFTPYVQQAHAAIIHVLCGLIEENLTVSPLGESKS